jgi:hypothetical protein
MQKNKINNVFDWVKEISYDKSPWSSFSNEEHELFSNFMVNKIISMSPNYIELVAEIQEHPIPKAKLYQFYCQALPKQKFFNKYIKPSKAIYSNEVLSLLASYFQISTREILDYCHIISKQDVIDILLQTGVQDKEIKKLLK